MAIIKSFRALRPRAEQAQEWVALAGGVQNVLARAAELADVATEESLRLACHLIEHASLAEPTSAAVHELRARIYRSRSALQISSMARNILGHAVLASEQGQRDLAGNF